MHAFMRSLIDILSITCSLSLSHSLTPIYQLTHTPTALLTEELEDIAAAAASTGNPIKRGWAVDCTVQMGVTYANILECFMSFCDRWSSKVSQKHTHLLSSISYALIEWKKIASM